MKGIVVQIEQSIISQNDEILFYLSIKIRKMEYEEEFYKKKIEECLYNIDRCYENLYN